MPQGCSLPPTCPPGTTGTPTGPATTPSGMPQGCSLPPTCPPGSTGTPTGPATTPSGMPAGCTVTPAAPAPPAAPAAPVAPQATPPAPAPTPTTPVAEDVEGENAPTAGEEETPQGGVQGESDEGGPEDTTPVATASPGPAPEASAGELPFTGANAWWLGLLGLTVAGTGVVLRRRSAE
jgi:LPXTG-motif cell wall-anchored protein